MSKRKIIALSLGAALAMALSLTACKTKTASKTPSEDGPAGSAPLIIGLSLADLKEERWQRDRDYFVAKAESLGAKVIVQDAGGRIG